jgi:hypothetical protein
VGCIGFETEEGASEGEKNHQRLAAGKEGHRASEESI